MLALSHTAGYAILALSHLDLDGQHMMLTRQIAEATGIPRPYLSKILHLLGQSGIIRSRRGFLGGVILAKPATSITLLDIINAVSGKAWHDRCLLGLEPCNNLRRCALHEFWALERHRIAKTFADITLDKLALATAEARRRSGVIPAPVPTPHKRGRKQRAD